MQNVKQAMMMDTMMMCMCSMCMRRYARFDGQCSSMKVVRL